MSSATQPASASPLTWTAEHHAFPGARIATVALAREQWEALGAHFFQIDDPIGGITRLATGAARVVDTTTVPFGVLDHGEDTTFLLGLDEASVADLLVDAVVAGGVPRSAILERLPATPRALDERVQTLEDQLAQLKAFRNMVVHGMTASPEMLAQVIDTHRSAVLALAARTEHRIHDIAPREDVFLWSALPFLRDPATLASTDAEHSADLLEAARDVRGLADYAWRLTLDAARSRALRGGVQVSLDSVREPAERARDQRDTPEANEPGNEEDLGRRRRPRDRRGQR